MKVLNTFMALVMGLAVFAVLGSFIDVITNIEAVEIIGGCLVVLAFLGKMPERNTTN